MKTKAIISICLPALLLIAVSCTTAIKLPAVSEPPTNHHNSGQFVWHDLVTHDPAKAQSFYADVFGWEFETLGAGENSYLVISSNGKSIGGILQLAKEYGQAAEWVGSVSVPDIDKAIAYNQEAGGATVYGKAQFNNRGETALIKDPQDAFVALLTSKSGDPQPVPAGNVPFNEWLWNEFWSTNLTDSITFYKGLFGYTVETVKEAPNQSYVFKSDRQALAGAINNPVEGARSSWTPYIRVKDIKETVAKAEAAGAHIMMAPTPEVRKGSVAILLDPTGAQFAVQQWILR